MKQYLFALFIIVILFSSCEEKENPFTIKKQNIGLLTDSTQVKDLKAIFVNDSVIIDKPTRFGKENTIEILDKEGNQLLILTPEKAEDSSSTIGTVQIKDVRFKTEKGISTHSTFVDIYKNYKISHVDNLINSVVVTVNELNASFTIDKKELPANARFDMDLHIDASMIPDNAKIKYFMLHWQ